MSFGQASHGYAQSNSWASTASNMRTIQYFSYPQTSTTQLSPDSDAQSTSSDESSQSACSVASSQTSISSHESWQTEVESDPCEPIGKPICMPAGGYVQPPQITNPRRSSRDQVPPSLSRQHERKSQFVLHLVDSATCLVETIWPTSSPVCHTGAPLQHGTLPLRTFIEETLRRSKTSFSTLQVALFYIILLKDHLPIHDFTMQQPKDCAEFRALQCGRRMFLAALILGSKYLQDRNYSARAWSKISGLGVSEINLNEKALLAAVNWKLHIPEPTFNRWQDILIKYSQPSMVSHWQKKIPDLTSHYVANYHPSSAVLESTPISNFWATQQNSVDRMGAISWTNNAAPVTAACRPDTGYQAQPAIPSSAFKLTTPSPMSSICPTPAASLASEMLRNTCQLGAMRSAMSMVNNAATVRSCVDRRPDVASSQTANGISRWRSPASTGSRSNSRDQVSSSVVSSPGSMISDYGSSRSSSVSSVSIQSKDTSPNRNRLPRLASRNAMHKFVDMSAAAASVTFDDCVTVLDSEPLCGNSFMRSPEVIVIEDDATPVQYSFDSARDSRKRHRNSVDSVASSDLQDSVRRLMRQKPSFETRPMPTFQRKNSYEMGKPAAKKPCYTNESSVLDDIVTLDGPQVWKTTIY